MAAQGPDGSVTVPAPGRAGPLAGVSLALVVALAAAGWLLARAPDDAPAAAKRPATVESAWPHARRGKVPGTLPDGAAYSPAYFLDEQASVGTAPDPRGGTLRLVLRSADGGIRLLRRLPQKAGPQFAGFTRVGDGLVWAESTAARGGLARTELWRVDVASGGPPRSITADTGRAVFPNSEYDMVVEAGRLYWTAVAPGREAATEVRSVPLGGGPVEVRTVPGGWTLSRWPWLVSSGRNEPVRMHDLATGRVTTVDDAGDVLDTCGPSWCRVFVLSDDGPTRSELMRPDGSDRLRVADDGATAAIADVAALDRFEVLSGDSSALAAAIGGQRLSVFDIEARRLVTVVEAAGWVRYRGGVLWWSTGTGGSTVWHTLDLRSV